MPQSVNNVRKEQWQLCDRCGFLFPMSRLQKQKGLLVCSRRGCFDNLEVERRNLIIEQVLGTAVDQEGVDTRVVDRGFFEGFDEVDR